MGDGTKTIDVTLNWLGEPEKAIKLGDLPKFFTKTDGQGTSYGKKGGIYFWIHQGKQSRIAYIGEARQFQDRFLGERGHISNVFHGMYSAFDCDDDLLATYAKCIDGYSFQKSGDHFYNSVFGNPEFSWNNPECFEEITVKPDDYIQKIQEGIKLSVDYLRKMRFVFAEITPPDAKGKNGGAIRKQVEALCMLCLKGRLGKEYEKDEYKQPGMAERYYYKPDQGRYFFWGSATEKPEKNTCYTVQNLGQINAVVADALGLTGSEWTFSVDANGAVTVANTHV
jgi:hypothetical protein